MDVSTPLGRYTDLVPFLRQCLPHVSTTAEERKSFPLEIVAVLNAKCALPFLGLQKLYIRNVANLEAPSMRKDKTEFYGEISELLSSNNVFWSVRGIE